MSVVKSYSDLLVGAARVELFAGDFLLNLGAQVLLQVLLRNRHEDSVHLELFFQRRKKVNEKLRLLDVRCFAVLGDHVFQRRDVLVNHVSRLHHLLQLLVYLQHSLYQKWVVDLLQLKAQLLRQNWVVRLHWNEINIIAHPRLKNSVTREAAAAAPTISWRLRAASVCY